MSKVVVLDPGHGANTPGKRSPDGTLREYEFNGDVAERAKRLLEARGVKVILTRPTSKDARDVSLSERVAIANKAKANLFISVHANAHGNGREWTSARGYETYIFKKGGEAERLANRLVDWATKLLVPAGARLRPYPVREANFYVLRKTVMPAVLIEHSFMTNKDDCALLKSDAFRQKAAEHIARAVCEHLGVKYDQPPVVSKPSPSAAEKLYRLKTGTFSNAESLAAAKKRVKERFGWVVYEWAEGTYKNGGIWEPNYRLITGTFKEAEVQRAAEALRKETGWLVYVVEA